MSIRNASLQAFGRVIPREALAKPAHLHTNDAVRFGIERVPFVKRAGAKHVLLELVAAAREGFVNGEPQQLSETLGALERCCCSESSRGAWQWRS